MYYENQHGKSDLVIKINKSEYDIGFDFDKNINEYKLVYDKYNNQIKNVLGVNSQRKSLSSEEEELSHIAKFTVAYNMGLLKSDMLEKEFDFGVNEQEAGGYIITCRDANEIHNNEMGV